MATDWGRLGRVGAVGAAVAGSIAAGVAVQRAVVGRAGERDPERDEPLGLLRGRVVEVIADDGVRLHVEVDDPEPGSKVDDGLTIVFCHGFALNLDAFHYQRRDLRSLGRLVFFDQRSHGRSGRSSPENSVIAQLARDLDLILKTVAPEGPIVMVGHSMGGMTVMSYAANHPQEFGSRVQGVALMATSASSIENLALGVPQALADRLSHVVPGAVNVLARRAAVVDAVRHIGGGIGNYITGRLSFGSTVSPSVVAFADSLIDDTGIAVVADFLPTFEEHDLRDALAPLTHVETIILVGDKDLLTPEKYSRELAAKVPNARLTVLPDTGHLLELERYPEVNEEIRGLVRRVRQRISATERDRA